MVTVPVFRRLALGFPDTTELPHFEKTSFRVKKKIFATLSVENSIACVKLTLIDQSVFCLIDAGMIYPVPNKWGLQGWTNINLHKITKPVLSDILATAYNGLTNPPAKN